jgi:hypothetical protein
MSLKDFVVSPPSCGRSVTDFWGWDAHEAQLRCPDEYEVPGGALKLSSTKLPRPLQGKIPMAEPWILCCIYEDGRYAETRWHFRINTFVKCIYSIYFCFYCWLMQVYCKVIKIQLIHTRSACFCLTNPLQEDNKATEFRTLHWFYNFEKDLHKKNIQSVK